MESHSSGGKLHSKSASPSASRASYSIEPSASPPVKSASSTSTTSGFALQSLSALPTTAENSRSVNSTFASPWSSMKAIASASRRVLSVLSTAPNMAGAKCSSIIAGTLGSIAATVSPRWTPRLASADASRRQRAYVSRQLRRTSPWITAVRSGYTYAAFARNDTGVSGV